jgi:hypothetical protein
MSRLLILGFREPQAVLDAARRARDAHYELIDIYSPFPVEGAAELLGGASTQLRVHMFLGGMAFAAFAYGIEVWSAVFDYPINSGGRPLNSWPAFMLFPFAIGIFGAALTGFISFLAQCGLPRLHDPLFRLEGFERASQDRFLLALKAPAGLAHGQAKEWLGQMGATNVWDVET